MEMDPRAPWGPTTSQLQWLQDYLCLGLGTLPDPCVTSTSDFMWLGLCFPIYKMG